jgi:hypothetical protein
MIALVCKDGIQLRYSKKLVLMVFDHWSVRRVSTAWEWMEEALHVVKESDKHLAAGEGGE